VLVVNTCKYMIRAWCSQSHYLCVPANDLKELKLHYRRLRRGTCPDCGSKWTKVHPYSLKEK